MNYTFYKYQGAGNDFIIIDNRDNSFNTKDNNRIQLLCDRKFGIGADGLILLENSDKYDFKMLYFNADGKESTMCGNGGRCIVAFAKRMNIIQDKTIFEAIDGIHHAEIIRDLVNLQMIDVNFILENKDSFFLNTGSPHHVIFQDNIENLNVKEEGSKIRYSKTYKKDGGTNVNFVEQVDQNIFKVRTYERGVEDETLACGTGVTAVAIAAYQANITKSKHIFIHTEGGMLEVSFKKDEFEYNKVFLKGPATFVFKGDFDDELNRWMMKFKSMDNLN